MTISLTWSLTTGVNNFTGGAGADSFDGSLSTANQTLGSSDNLNGAGGVDSLSAVLTGGVTTATLKDIETVSLTATGAATFDLVNTTGATTLENTGSSNVLTFSNIASTATALKLSNTSTDGQVFAYTAAAVAGAADSATLTLSNVTDAGGVVTIP